MYTFGKVYSCVYTCTVLRSLAPWHGHIILHRIQNTKIQLREAWFGSKIILGSNLIIKSLDNSCSREKWLWSSRGTVKVVVKIDICVVILCCSNHVGEFHLLVGWKVTLMTFIEKVHRLQVIYRSSFEKILCKSLSFRHKNWLFSQFLKKML